MQRRSPLALLLAVAPLLVVASVTGESQVQHTKGHHHHHHHKGHHHHHGHHGKTAVAGNATARGPAARAPAKAAAPMTLPAAMPDKEKNILFKLERLEKSFSKGAGLKANITKKAEPEEIIKGRLLVNGPVPEDFNDCFITSVTQATDCMPGSVRVLDATQVPDAEGFIVEVVFEGPKGIVEEVQRQASEPNSKLTNGPMREYLVAKEGYEAPSSPKKEDAHGEEEEAIEVTPQREEDSEPTPVKEQGVDIDTAMPYGDLEPFGREDTAQELTESSVKESDQMVDQLERAEVAEEKRAIFRALTRLRGAAITAFDGIARSQTSSLDEYNKVHKWRNSHPLHHLADEESDVTKWAFPDNADF